MTAGAAVGEWSRWRPSAAPLTVGLEEEIMLLVPGSWALFQGGEGVLRSLNHRLGQRASAETHASTLELATGVHATVGTAVAELRALRAELVERLRSLGLAAASAGIHPHTTWRETAVSEAPRYRALGESLRGLVEREPTFGLHVHVGMATPEEAVRVMNGLRNHLPLLLALSANSPFWQGRDTGLASMRVPLFDAFPRTGPPRGFAQYGEWVGTVGRLIDSGAIPEPTFLWWDLRLQPKLGTVEMRIMDAQTTLAGTAALAAMVQCLARAELARGDEAGPIAEHELLEESRFLAARDGMAARLIDLDGRLVPAGVLLRRALEACEPHARTLGCAAELAGVEALARGPGAERQRRMAQEIGSLTGLVAALAADYVTGPEEGEWPAPAE